MPSFRRARMGAIVLSLFLSCQLCHALDPFQQEQADQQKRALEDPNKFSRPVTNELKGAEIKDYRDKINAVRAQVFREGTPPAGASLRPAVKDRAGNETPNAYVAEGRFQDFTPTVRRQIEAKLQGAPAKDERIQVQMTVGQDAVSVADARLAPNLKTAVDAVSKVPANTNARPSGLDVPRPQAPGPLVRPLRSTVEAPAVKSRDASFHDTGAGKKSPDVRTTPAPLAKPAAPVTVAAAAPVPASFPGLAAVAAVLVGAPAASPATTAAPAEPVALIPVPKGEPLVVTNRSPDAKTQIVSVTGPASALPEALKNQVRADKGAAVLPTDASPVQITVEIRPDRTLRVVDVKPAASGAVALDAKAAMPTRNESAAPAPASGSRSPENAAPASPVAQAPASPQAVSDQPFPAVTGAKALATAIGIDPSTVRLKSPEETAEPKSLSLPAADDRTVHVETIKTDSDNKPSVVRADGRFGDFSPETKQQIREILGHFNAAPLVDDNSRVVFEARPGATGKPAIVSISIQDPKAPDEKTVIVWKEGEAVKPGEAPPPAQDAKPTSGPVVADNPGTPTRPAVQPAVPPRAVGLAPSAAAIASKVYGLPDTGFELKPTDPKGGIKIDPVPAGRAPVVVEPQPVEREGMHDFASVGKDVDFTDAIRAEVDAKLKAAVENGETWASDALKGNRQVLVTFEVDETGPQPVVRVKDVAPTMQDAANDAAVAMGLRPGEFFIVNVGDQALVVLEQGAKGEVRMADVAKFKLVSPDGDAKVFVNPNKARKDPTTVLMLSRESLKANRAALVNVSGPVSEATIKACMDANPKAGQFIVRLDPNADEKLVIKAMQAGVPDPALTTVKKRPEDDK